MNIHELDNYNLADAVKFNQELNPRIWQGQHMVPAVREKLLEIAEDFIEFLGLSDLEIKDITISGSNAAYSYTPHSDIDLHLVVDLPQADENPVYRELFDAKKYQYNDEHNITIGGHDVELYVENANVPPVSQGVYSLLKNDWIHIPKRHRSNIDDDAVRSKYEDLKQRILAVLDDNDSDKVNKLIAKIKKMRQSSLDEHGELGVENLAYKMLRTQGLIEKLYQKRQEIKDQQLSLAERRKKKKKPKYVYGGWFGNLIHPPASTTQSDAESSGPPSAASSSPPAAGVVEASTPDGVGPSTRMFLSEFEHQDVIKKFIKMCSQELKLKNIPKIILKRQSSWSEQNGSFGHYDMETNSLTLSLYQRHIMDVLRTLAHELVHAWQQETQGIPLDGGETGSPWENQANAEAGKFMRKFAEKYPEYFSNNSMVESSGYIPTKAEKNDPRFIMALSKDVQPGETGRQANKLNLETDSQGRPKLLI
jgi:hypothetical protein